MYGSNNELIRFGPWGAGLPEPAEKVIDEFFLNFIAGSLEVVDPLIQHADLLICQRFSCTRYACMLIHGV